MKKAISTILVTLITTIMMSLPASAYSACVSVSPISSKTINKSDHLSFTVKYTNDILKINFSEDDIDMIGFTGDVFIKSFGNCRVVDIYNITSTDSFSNKRIKIQEGTAISSSGSKSNAVLTEAFFIK